MAAKTPQQAKPHGKLSVFDRDFDPDQLVKRKDVTWLMRTVAEGKTKQVIDYVSAPGEFRDIEVFDRNRDGNTPLLFAVVNNHPELAQFLLEVKSDPCHRNVAGKDAFDYATADGLRTPMAKTVLAFCDYVAPDACDGPFWSKSLQAIQLVQEKKRVVVRSALVGRRPDLLAPGAKEAEYTMEWLRGLRALVGMVRKGILLLCSEVGYLERDANMTGCLDMPVNRRYVFVEAEGKVVKYTKAMELPHVYGEVLTQRVMEACLTGNLAAVKGLLKASAAADVEDLSGQSALMRAAQKGDSEIVRCLIGAKAKVDTKNKDGFTALLLASTGNHTEVARMLLQARADPQAQSRKGFTVLSFVKHQGHPDVLKVFTEEREKAAAASVAVASRTSLQSGLSRLFKW